VGGDFFSPFFVFYFFYIYLSKTKTMKNITFYVRPFATQEISVVLEDYEWQPFQDRIDGGESIETIFDELWETGESFHYGTTTITQPEYAFDATISDCDCKKRKGLSEKEWEGEL